MSIVQIYELKEPMRSFPHFIRRGFTLIELLVVISIIAILMALGAVSYSNAQKKARDAQRISEMTDIQRAMEQEHGTNGVYPDFVNGSPVGLSGNCTGANLGNELATFPTDPQSAAAYECAQDANSNPKTYCVCAYLEANDDYETEDCNGTDAVTGRSFYCVRNRQ